MIRCLVFLILFGKKYRIMDLLSKLKHLSNKKVLYINTGKFDIEKIRVDTRKRLKEVFTLDMSDQIVYNWLLLKEYEKFLLDYNYDNTSLDSFYEYYKKYCTTNYPKEITYKEIEANFFVMKKNYWENVAHKFFENPLYKAKTESEFELFLGNNYKWFLIEKYKSDWREFFAEIHRQFLAEKKENNFWLKNNEVDNWLKDLLENWETWDGSFLYKWETKDKNGISTNSWIELFNKAANSGLYKDLKKNEMNQWMYIFNVILRNTDPNIYKEIKKIITNSKFIAEIWPWGTDKLLQVLKMFYENDKNKLSDFFSEKMIKFLDLDEAWYIGIKEEIKDYITKNANVEWSTWDMRNAKSSVYSNLDKTSYFMFWWTIGNFSLDEIWKIFTNMNTHKRNKPNNAFITYFTEPKTDEEEKFAVDLYSHKEMENFILSWFEALWFPREKIKYIVRYESKKGEDPWMIKIWAEVVSDVEILSPSWKIYKKKKWEIVWAVNSLRFWEDDLKNIAEKHDFNLKISTWDKKNVGVASAVFESKWFLFNDKFKRPRSIIYGVLISSMLLSGWWYLLQKFDQNSIQSKIKDHKKKIIYNKSLFYFEYLWEINSISEELAEEFISIYWTKNLTYETIRKEIALYLKDFTEWNSRLNEIKKAPNDLELKDMFLADFVENHFYEKMFENGFDNLEPEPFLKGMEKNLIETLKYKWPLKEWYNEKEWLWYVIHAPEKLYSIETSNGEIVPLVQWYIVPHRCESITIKVPEVWYDMALNNYDPTQIILSKTKPDSDWKITIKKIILGNPLSNGPINWRSEIALKDLITNYKPILFRIDKTETSVREQKNLTVDQVSIIEYFEKKDALFKKTWDLFKKLSKCEKHYMGKPYLPQEISQLKKEMIIDLYEDRPFWRNVISTFKNNDKKMIDYVWEFIKKHENILK